MAKTATSGSRPSTLTSNKAHTASCTPRGMVSINRRGSRRTRAHVARRRPFEARWPSHIRSLSSAAPSNPMTTDKNDATAAYETVTAALRMVSVTYPESIRGCSAAEKNLPMRPKPEVFVTRRRPTPASQRHQMVAARTTTIEYRRPDPTVRTSLGRPGAAVGPARGTTAFSPLVPMASLIARLAGLARLGRGRQVSRA